MFIITSSTTRVLPLKLLLASMFLLRLRALVPLLLEEMRVMMMMMIIIIMIMMIIRYRDDHDDHRYHVDHGDDDDDGDDGDAVHVVVAAAAFGDVPPCHCDDHSPVFCCCGYSYCGRST